jgi:D-lactate dehydrogenase
MKIAFFEYEDWMQEQVCKLLPDDEVVFVKEPLTQHNASQFEDVEAVSVFVFSRLNQEVLALMPALKLIAARSTGFDHIDLKAASDRNILVTNVPSYGAVTVAEHTWALILALSRQITLSFERTEQANFEITGLRGFDLQGKTLGLVGLGEIGKRVAEMSRGFGMKIRIFNRSRDLHFADTFDNCVFVDKVEDLLSHADVISFHVPLTPQTLHLINLENYQTLKPGCVVINTSRGPIIDTKALIKGLQEGIIRGAGLDVLESEAVVKGEREVDIDNLPKPQELTEAYLTHALIDMDNVIITPHNAFNSDESIIRLVDSNIEQIRNFKNEDTTLLARVN